MTLALELVNSEWWRGRPDGVVDKLEDDEWLQAFAREAGLGELGPPSKGERRRLHALRDLLRELVETRAGAGFDRLDPYVAGASVRRHIVGESVALEPVERDWRWAESEIAASFVELLAHGEPTRLKVCANHDCQWAFYDSSKNRSRRWCGSPTCGTADKVRRFRARRREQQAA
jgi:predicted RNA-binding Zn ribbon-like protein